MILHLSNHYRRLLLICLAAVSAGPAIAQQEDRWFRVELLVFSNEGSQHSELWDPTPTLAYPGSGRFLVRPEQVEANLEQYRAESVVDEFGRQILTMLPENEPGQAPSPAPADPNQALATAKESGPPRPTPFIALPAGQREFRGKAAYMQRSGRYRTLFHQTWVQPVADSDNALPLILDRSGDTGDWPRLQGSVTLYLSRYLHLDTKLWLNTSGDYLPGEWRMPAPPLGPPSLIIEELPPEEETTAPFGEQWLEPTSDGDPLGSGEKAATEEESLAPVYPWRHAVVLQQKRRMRSTEVHYLDHPLFGLVIKLTPLTEEDLEILSAAEALGSPGS